MRLLALNYNFVFYRRCEQPFFYSIVKKLFRTYAKQHAGKMPALFMWLEKFNLPYM